MNKRSTTISAFLAISTAKICSAREFVTPTDPATIRAYQQWYETFSPHPSLTLVFLVLFSIAIILAANQARAKGISTTSSFFLAPLIFGLLTWLLATANIGMLRIHMDMGYPPPNGKLHVVLALLVGAKWYGPLGICSLWLITHPIWRATGKRSLDFIFLFTQSVVIAWLFASLFHLFYKSIA